MKAPLFSLREVGFGYPGGRTILAGCNFDLFAGERVAVLGANGAGKTTLLHLLVGLRKATAGRLFAFGAERRKEEDFREVRARAGLLFQDPDDQLFCPTVLEDVAFGPLNLGKKRDEALAIAEGTLAVLGLAALADRITHKLSGGEKRLVSLAAVLAMQPEVLLLDEPTNGLDADADSRLVELLSSMPQAMLFVAHDSRLIARLAERAVLLAGGALHPASIHAHPHTHAHTHPHLHLQGAAVEDHEGRAHGLTHVHSPAKG